MTEAASVPHRASMAPRLGVVGCSVLVHVAAWIAPALQFDTTSEGQWVPRGIEVALLGWQGLFVGNFAWLANILYFPGLIVVLLRWWRTAALLGAAALAVGLHTFALVGQDVPADEGGVTRMALAHPRAGFYLWMASMAVIVAGSLWCRWREASAATGAAR